MNHTPVKAPGGFAPAFALGHADVDGNLALIDASNPLPVRLSDAVGPSPLPLEGSANDAAVAGPFTPTSGRAIYIKLSGTWDGEVRVLRSTDGGSSKNALTIAGAPWGVFAANACEAVWEENEAGAELYLELAPTSGTIEYRVSQ